MQTYHTTDGRVGYTVPGLDRLRVVVTALPNPDCITVHTDQLLNASGYALNYVKRDGVVQLSELCLPSSIDASHYPHALDIAEKIYMIPGIIRNYHPLLGGVSINDYSITVYKARAFTADEIIDGVLRVLKDFFLLTDEQIEMIEVEPAVIRRNGLEDGLMEGEVILGSFPDDGEAQDPMGVFD